MNHAVSLGEHASALSLLTSAPIGIMAALTAVELGGRSGIPAAGRLRAAYLSSSAPVRLAALGMAISATIHLGLVASHASEGPVLAVLLGLDGIALAALAVCAPIAPLTLWRVVAGALLAGSVSAYLGFLAAGLERPDPLGIATKLLELAVLGLLLAVRARGIHLPALARERS